MSVNYLDQLADFVANTRLEELDTSTLTAAKAVVLDTIGAILAGSRLPENAGLAGMAPSLGGAGKATLLGHTGKVKPMFAALVNATAGVALEMDEGSRLGGGHPSIHVTPGALAMGEELGSSGAAVLESIIVGYEVTSRLGTGTQVRPEIHSHGTWGTPGAAAATARLLGFHGAQTQQAINLAMSMSPANTWTPCLEGATIRNLYPGRSSFQGILAAHLCQCGFTAVEDGPNDLYSNVLGREFTPEAVVEGLGRPGEFRIQQNYFKLHACCLYNHPVLDAVQTLVRKEQFTAGDIAQVEVTAPEIALIMDNPEPGNMLAAKFSIPYAVAAAISHGATDVPAFFPDRVRDPKIREVAQYVKVIADPQMSLRRYDYPAARVVVTLKDGRAFQESVTAQRGDHHNPASRQELERKFTNLSGETLDPALAQEVIGMVGRMEQLENIGELTKLLGKNGG